VNQVGYLQRLYQDAQSTEHKIKSWYHYEKSMRCTEENHALLLNNRKRTPKQELQDVCY